MKKITIHTAERYAGNKYRSVKKISIILLMVMDINVYQVPNIKPSGI